MSDDGFVEDSPTLAIEVVSPNDRERDIAAKVEEYFDAGAQRVWIVRPKNRTVTVHRPRGDAHTYSVRDTLTSADAAFAVEGFALSLGELFAE
jgi:Uma2 family endonuclease